MGADRLCLAVLVRKVRRPRIVPRHGRSFLPQKVSDAAFIQACLVNLHSKLTHRDHLKMTHPGE